MAKNLALPLQEYLNKLGFISEINKEFYGVLLNDEVDLTDQEITLAQEQGLAGLTIILSKSAPLLYQVAN